MNPIAVGDLIDKVRPKEAQLIAISLEHHHRLAAALHAKHLLTVAVAAVQHLTNCHGQFFAF